MPALIERILAKKRSGMFRSKLLFEPHRSVSELDLTQVELRIDAKLPEDLAAWLLAVGYGDLDEDLSFRSEWFKKVEQGELKGAVLFAQDVLGNFYAFVPVNGSIVYFSRSAPEYAVLAANFSEFMAELERRDFKVLKWVESVNAYPYAWYA